MQRGGEALDAVLGLLVEHHHVVPEIAAMPAIFLRHGNAEQPGLARLAPERAFDLPVLAPFVHPLLGRVPLEELADRVCEKIAISSSSMNSGWGMSITGILFSPAKPLRGLLRGAG